MLKQAALLSDQALHLDGPYIEKAVKEAPWYDRAAGYVTRNFLQPVLRTAVPDRYTLKKIVSETLQHEAELKSLSDSLLKQRVLELRRQLLQRGFDLTTVGLSFALVREAASRTVNKRHYPSQLMAGWGMLQGHMVEMQTGEGKTLSATLAAATVALAGCPVHVITVNGYLAERDSDEMAPIYRFLGLSCSAISEGMEPEQKREIYRGNITYCTNKDLAFDYLRDRVATGQARGRLQLAVRDLFRERAQGQGDYTLRGLYYAIVDEADSVFVDEARTPLILSKSVPSSVDEENCSIALSLSERLEEGRDFTLEPRERSIRLTDAGKDMLDQWAKGRDGVWSSTLGRRELIIQALSARLLFERDHHYVVQDQKVQIVDESTGRIMADRSWERGLHQMIEKKEGCDFTEKRETLARITYQRLFQRYVRLGGMTGTAREIQGELASVYALKVVDIPLHQSSKRQYLPRKVLPTLSEKWRAVASRVEELAVGQGRPVLIGTRSVKASEEISAILHAQGIEHALLNAKQDQDEAEIISRAGGYGRVTVATNMAGRGTDIHLHRDVMALGGLHVILTEYHFSRRLDRQLFGRCARQGDPGSCEAIVSLEDEVFTVHTPKLAQWAKRWMQSSIPLPGPFFFFIIRYAQGRAEQQDAARRMQNMKVDRQLDKLLAFSGRGE